MRLLFLVNAVDDVRAAQTTAMLTAAACRREHEVWVTGLGDVTLSETDRVLARARRVRQPDPEAIVAELAVADPALIDVSGLDAVMVRANAGRPPNRFAAATALELLRIAREHGVLVLNDPDGLARASSKLYQTVLPPRFRPPTVVSRDRDVLCEFVAGLDGPAVLKPLQGTHGTDVFLVQPDHRVNLDALIAALTREGFAMAQAWVPESVDGDTRVLLVDGRLLQVGSEVALVRRIPPPHDFRSNIHAGGKAAPGRLDEDIREIVSAIGPRLRQDGLFLVGLDVIGSKVVEVNAWAPGGLRDANRYAGVDFSGPILDAFEARVAAARVARSA